MTDNSPPASSQEQRRSQSPHDSSAETEFVQESATSSTSKSSRSPLDPLELLPQHSRQMPMSVMQPPSPSSPPPTTPTEPTSVVTQRQGTRKRTLTSTPPICESNVESTSSAAAVSTYSTASSVMDHKRLLKDSYEIFRPTFLQLPQADQKATSEIIRRSGSIILTFALLEYGRIHRPSTSLKILYDDIFGSRYGDDADDDTVPVELLSIIRKVCAEASHAGCVCRKWKRKRSLSPAVSSVIAAAAAASEPSTSQYIPQHPSKRPRRSLETKSPPPKMNYFAAPLARNYARELTVPLIRNYFYDNPDGGDSGDTTNTNIFLRLTNLAMNEISSAIFDETLSFDFESIVRRYFLEMKRFRNEFIQTRDLDDARKYQITIQINVLVNKLEKKLKLVKDESDEIPSQRETITKYVDDVCGQFYRTVPNVLNNLDKVYEENVRTLRSVWRNRLLEIHGSYFPEETGDINVVKYLYDCLLRGDHNHDAITKEADVMSTIATDDETENDDTQTMLSTLAHSMIMRKLKDFSTGE